ncbi:MAG: hypothetical protein AB9891_20675 [Anaerolineaceae bacterium]
MEKVQFTTVKGKQVLIEDFTGIKPGQEFDDLIKTAHDMITGQPPKSVLAVFDATGASFNMDMLSKMKEFTASNTPFVKAAAVVGITGLLEVALSTVSKFAGRDFVSFKTRQEAIDWLVSQ